MKIKLTSFLILLFEIAHLTAWSTGLTCSTNGCTGIDEPQVVILSNHQSNVMFPFGCYTGLDCPTSPSSINLLDSELLNLKKDISIPNGKIASINSAIQITQSDFENFVQTDKSILFSQGFYNFFYMNIGIADAINAQTWTLPSNLAEYVGGNTIRIDIISPSSIPPSLQVAGATHVLKRIESESNGEDVDNYMHLQIDGTEVTDLGTSYDFDSGSDDNFDEEPDVELYDVPLNLGDSQTTDDFPIDEITNDNYVKINTVSTVDAFGIINTPYGSFDCLRQTEITKYFRRANGSASFGTTPNYEFRRVKWITKNGFIFSAAVQSENPSHIGLLGFMELTRFVPTNTLTSQSAVKINNDSFGVSINNTDFYAHESAILDISSDSLGILIPRIAQANRPSSPAEGLLVYQIDNGAGFYYFDGTMWNKLSATPSSSARVSYVSRYAQATSNNTVAERSRSQSGKNQLKDGTTFIKFDSPRDDFEDILINIQLEDDCNGVISRRKLVKDLK